MVQDRSAAAVEVFQKSLACTFPRISLNENILLFLGPPVFIFASEPQYVSLHTDEIGTALKQLHQFLACSLFRVSFSQNLQLLLGPIMPSAFYAEQTSLSVNGRGASAEQFLEVFAGTLVRIPLSQNFDVLVSKSLSIRIAKPNLLGLEVNCLLRAVQGLDSS